MLEYLFFLHNSFIISRRIALLLCSRDIVQRYMFIVVAMTLQAIKYNYGSLKILDQLLLPHQTKYIDVNDVNDGWEAIKKMQVRLRQLQLQSFTPSSRTTGAPSTFWKMHAEPLCNYYTAFLFGSGHS